MANLPEDWVQGEEEHQIPRIFIIAGPTATGKSTVASAIAQRYGLPYVEGDNLHSQENIDKMAHGHPLTDSDRWDWLNRICETSLEASAPPSTPPHELLEHPSRHTPACITSCSALKRTYRDNLREQLQVLEPDRRAVLYFIFLTASMEELIRRTESRRHHYMKSDMVVSQLEDTEVPRTGEEGEEEEGEEEERDCKVIRTDDLSIEEVVEKAVEVVKEIMITEFE